MTFSRISGTSASPVTDFGKLSDRQAQWQAKSVTGYLPEPGTGTVYLLMSILPSSSFSGR